jgi:putative ATP-grasp target RiPP
MMQASDLLRAGQHFPLGVAFGPDPDRPAAIATVRPFGLRWAQTPSAAGRVELDWSAIGYDPERQIATVDDGEGHVLPAMRHTSTQTTTSTSEHDRNPPDSDTDATGT